MPVPADPIGIFDSGLGGPICWPALIDVLPDERFVYFGDTGRFPYGRKPADEVLKYSFEIADLLVERTVKMLVVACNSASAGGLGALRERLDLPVVGVIEPGLRAHASALATAVSASSAPSARSRRVRTNVGRGARSRDPLTCAACPGFVEFVEAGDVESDQVHVLAERLLAPMIDARVDTLVLGCTYYPLCRARSAT